MDIVSRRTWGVRTPLAAATVRTPVSKVYVQHTVTRTTGDPYADMRVVDNVGRSRFGRISYSWVIHPDGTVMEGAGDHVGAHTADQNSTSFGIAFIGNYETQRLTPQAIASFRELRQWLVDTGRATVDHEVIPHNMVSVTASPGAYVLADWNKLLAPSHKVGL